MHEIILGIAIIVILVGIGLLFIDALALFDLRKTSDRRAEDVKRLLRGEDIEVNTLILEGHDDNEDSIRVGRFSRLIRSIFKPFKKPLTHSKK